MNKSVISVACHPEKTVRFYKQIGYEDRCVSLYDNDEFQIHDLMEKYYSSQISVSESLKKEAVITWHKLKEFIKNE